MWYQQILAAIVQSAVVELPLLGRIAAGTPIEALSDPSSYTAVPQNMVSGGEHFALEIVGDSMIEAGIHDGDTVIIHRTESANSGDIIVALIDDSEATDISSKRLPAIVKTLRKEAGRIGLEPANPNCVLITHAIFRVIRYVFRVVLQGLSGDINRLCHA